MWEWAVDHLAVFMFLSLVVLMFSGYPVAFVLGAIGIFFGFLGILGGTFSMLQFGNLLPRIYGQAIQNPVLVALPYAHSFFLTSFLQSESSEAPNGLPARWAIKLVLYLALWGVLLSVISVAFRRFVFLFGPAARREHAHPAQIGRAHV